MLNLGQSNDMANVSKPGHYNDPDVCCGLPSYARPDPRLDGPNREHWLDSDGAIHSNGNVVTCECSASYRNRR